jgi:hypothetical protein
MDPYLEGSLWTSIHAQLSAEIARQLAPKLRPRYIALMNEYFVMEVPESVAVVTTGIYPDVAVAERKPQWSERGGAMIADAPLRLLTVMPERVPHVTVEIRDTARRELVTAIEVLSPTNKRGEGRREYLTKRQRILLSTAHLMEIDLLRQGQPIPMQQPLPKKPYFVFLSRAELRPLTDVWPIDLNEPLPTVPVPLFSSDPDVELDLQQAFNHIYGLGYDLAVDYTRPPEIPLAGEEAIWAQARIEEWVKERNSR